MKLKGEYFTINEMAVLTGRTYNAVKQFLYRENIKPLTAESLYDKKALEAIKNAPPPGRPRKGKAG